MTNTVSAQNNALQTTSPARLLQLSPQINYLKKNANKPAMIQTLPALDSASWPAAPFGLRLHEIPHVGSGRVSAGDDQTQLAKSSVSFDQSFMSLLRGIQNL